MRPSNTQTREGGSRLETAGDRTRPLVSVITVVLRDREELGRILDNVARFRGEDLEFIVIDGGSSDGTVELLESRSDDVDYWLSEADTGIYEAMNKGLKVARGEFVLHLNAGDRLLKVPAEWLRARRSFVDVVPCRVRETRRIFFPRPSWYLRVDNAWHHQGTFYQREAHPGYDGRYRVFGDFDLNQRMLLARKRVELCPEIVAEHASGGLSSGSIPYREKLGAIRENFGRFWYNIARCVYFAEYCYWLTLGRLQRFRR